MSGNGSQRKTATMCVLYLEMCRQYEAMEFVTKVYSNLLVYQS